jgi:hypothetical protein
MNVFRALMLIELLVFIPIIVLAGGAISCPCNTSDHGATATRSE